MERRGLDPNRPLNDVDIQNPSVRDAIESDPTLSREQKDQIFKTGSPAIKTASESTPVPPSSVEPATEPASAQKYRIGTSPKLFTLLERLKPTTSEKENNEQPVLVKNDKTGEEQVVMESDLTPVRERTAEERAEAKTGKEDLDERLRAAGMEPSAFSNAKQKREALRRSAAKGKVGTKAEALAEALETLKVKGSGVVQASWVPGLDPATARAVWNTAIDVAQRVLRAGGSVADAVERAIESIRVRVTGEWDDGPARVRLQSELEAREKRGQVYGESDIGREYTPEAIEPVRGAVRQGIFDGRVEVSPEQTDRAWSLARELANPETKVAALERIREVSDAEMAPALFVGELQNYALREAVAGNGALRGFMVENHADFAVGGAKDVVTFKTAGRILRAAREMADKPLWKNDIELATATAEAAGRELGIGDAKLTAILTELRNASPEPAEVERRVTIARLPSGETVQQALDVGGQSVTPEVRAQRATSQETAQTRSLAQKTAEQIMNRMETVQTEWVKPENRNAVRDIVREAMRSDEPITSNPELFTQPLSERLVAAGVTKPIADRLAFEIQRAREDVWANQRERATRRAAESGRVSSLIESILSTPYRAQTDPAWRLRTAEDWFMSNGLSREQAQQAAKAFDQEFVSA